MILTEPIAFVIVGPPRTKGNGPDMFPVEGRGIVRIPDKLYREWNKSAQMQMAIIKRKIGNIFPITGPVWVKALVYRQRNAGDLDNFEKGLGDALQQAGIIVNDNQIVSWNDSVPLKDDRNPRVEIFITSVEISIRPIAG